MSKTKKPEQKPEQKPEFSFSVAFQASNHHRKFMLFALAGALILGVIVAFVVTMGSLGEMSARVHESYEKGETPPVRAEPEP